MLGLLCVLCVVLADASVVHRVGVMQVRTAEGFRPSCPLSTLTDTLSVRQYNVQEWFQEATNGAISITYNVATLRDVFGVTLTSSGTSCESWRTILGNAFRAAGGTGTYDSYIWVFPENYPAITGCDAIDTEGLDVSAELGPCAGGCHNFVRGCAFLNSYYYLIGRNMGLTRSHALNALHDDFTCQMGAVVGFPGSHRRGLNALKLMKLGVVTPVTSQASFTQFVSALYMYETTTPGAVKLIKLLGTNFYLSYRGPDEQTVDRNNNFGVNWVPGSPAQLNGVIHVHSLNSDGSSTWYKVIGDGETYSVPGTSWRVRQDWHNREGAQISASNTGALPQAVAEPAVVIPASGTSYTGTSFNDCAEQSSVSTNCYGGSPALDLCWLGDDRNNTSCMLITVNVPRSATILSATLILEADREQTQASTGTSPVWLVVENSDNAQTLSGNLFTRAGGYVERSPRDLTGTWYFYDEVPLDATAHIQAVVSRPGWVAGNRVNLCINSRVVGSFLTRTASSGVVCGQPGGRTDCGPRLRIQYTDGGGGQPVPQDCQFQWSAWSECTNVGNVCESPGTQARNLIVLTSPLNGGEPCPSPDREERSCTTADCVPVPKNCVWRWGAWSSCTGDCSSFGQRTRDMIIDQLPENGGTACPSVRTQTDTTCETAACPPVNCIMNWGAWSTCSGNCETGVGTQTRTGNVLIPAQFGGTACPTSPQTQSCQVAPCVLNCVVTYGDWSDCFGPCGGGSGVRQRIGVVQQEPQGGGTPCPQLLLTEQCTTAACPPVDCVFSWSYGACSGGPCGGQGTQTRTAVVTTPAVGTGTPCPAPQDVSCSMPACVGDPVAHVPVSELTAAGRVTSGSFTSVGSRENNQQETIQELSGAIEHSWQIPLPVADSLELDMSLGVTSLGSQQVLVQWAFLDTPWTTVVTLTSNGGVQERQVPLLNEGSNAQMAYVRIVNTDNGASGNTRVTVDYLAIKSFSSGTTTAVDCFQGAAVASQCSTLCGSGVQTLSRPTLQAPMNGGRPCDLSSWTVPCNVFTHCPTDCVVSAYTAFSQCNAQCGSGTRTRTRTIVSQPAFGGAACPALSETVPCSATPCAGANCIWGPWEPVGSCSQSCGTGEQTFERSIAWAGSTGGQPCAGATTKVEPCSLSTCGGSSATVSVRALLVEGTEPGSFFQAWPEDATEVFPDVFLVYSGRATDESALNPANGYWLLQRPAQSACGVTDITLQCPTGTNSQFANIGGEIGKLQCHDSIGSLNNLANATITVVC